MHHPPTRGYLPSTSHPAAPGRPARAPSTASRSTRRGRAGPRPEDLPSRPVQRGRTSRPLSASRTLIDKALDITMGRQRCTAERAFQVLGRASWNRNVRLRDGVITQATGQRPTANPPLHPRPTPPVAPPVRRPAPVRSGAGEARSASVRPPRRR
ncbi:ANTAR domain-containing protein [Streptomyces sp. CC219B]|uniref:ANTAR domain-containing protein n=1 Tax=Streptomyces sp. CC219B TaxID=3044574 RepID=UPI0024A8A9CB|nr:ANTAR domain-containing protein [Streptomyces sp. CC219B]